MRSETARIQRIGRRRFAQAARRHSPAGMRPAALLEHWADRAVLTREWKLGPCPNCDRTSFVPRLDIQRRVTCPACGNRLSLQETVPLGYSLHRTVRLALREGVVPVALTGRFLRNMTSMGFFWLPGVKYQADGRRGDIDLLACCDGYLVFCECKQLEGTPPGTKVWEDVVAQFLETAAVAKRCGAHLAVSAAHGTDYPPDVRDQIMTRLGGSIPHLLLTKEALEMGRREVQDGAHTRPMGFGDLLPLSFPEQPRAATAEPRTINMRRGVWSRG